MLHGNNIKDYKKMKLFVRRQDISWLQDNNITEYSLFIVAQQQDIAQ